MTVQKAIKKEINECKRRIFRIKDFMENNKDANIDECKDNIFVLETAIQALEGLEQYRALGTPTQILERIGGLDVELGKYHCLGTVEELTNQKHNLSVAYKCIEELQQPKVDWIPCEERLPENDEDVLVQMEDDSMMVDFRTASSSGWFWADNDDLPIAWQPLPAPYKKEGAK